MFFTKIKDFSKAEILFFKFKDFPHFQGPVGTMYTVSTLGPMSKCMSA